MINLISIIAYIQDQLIEIDGYSRNKIQIIAFFVLPDKIRKEMFTEILPTGVYSPEIQEITQFFEDIPNKRKYVASEIKEYPTIREKIDNFVEFFKVNNNMDLTKFLNLYHLIFDLENKDPSFYGLKIN